MKNIILVLFLFSIDCFSGVGATGANFLKFSYSAREGSLAGAYSAIGDDSNSIFSNPAGLSLAKKTELSLGFTSYLQDSKMGLLSFVKNYKKGKLGIGLSALNISDIEERGLIDQVGILSPTSSFSSNDIALFLSYAQENCFSSYMKNLNFGATFKMINSKIYNTSAFAVAMDFGFLYRYSLKTNYSLVLMNLGTKMKYDEESDSLPLNLKIGMSYNAFKNTNFLTEISEYFSDEKVYPSFAIEHILRDVLALRAGYKFSYDTSNLGSEVGLSFGFGIKAQDIGLNYAYIPFGDLGNINKFDFQIKF